jgi:hypothetical protein
VDLIVPGRSYLHARVKRATPEKTAGDDDTGGSYDAGLGGVQRARAAS